MCLFLQEKRKKIIIKRKKRQFYFSFQVAELMACIAKNPDLSYYKVLEVIAETTAPLISLEDLLRKIPSKVANGFPEKVSCFCK